MKSSSVDATESTHIEIETADSFMIHGFEWAPKGAQAVIVIASAMGVKQDFYWPFAEWLASQGFIAVTFDYRGMGRSRPPSLRGFEATIEDWATKDCAALLEDLAARHELPIYWIGHSVGAQLLGLVPNRHRIKAMLSVAAGSGYWQHNAAPLRYYVLSLWFLIMPISIWLAGYFPGKRLGMVGDLPRGVAEQWRKWCLDASYFGAEGATLRAQVADVKTPITALSMQDDELMTLRGTKALFSLFESAPLDVQRLRPKDVGVRRIGHFGFFREAMQDKLWPIVPAWAGRDAAEAATSPSCACAPS